MPILLCIESATTVCSVSLVRDGHVLSVRESSEGLNHAEKLTVFVEEVFHEAGVPMSDIDGVAVSGGPGSYTGLRIGVSTAKGLCWALDKPLLAIPTLLSMANGVRTVVDPESNAILCPMLDARRMEVYTAAFSLQLDEIASVEAVVLDQLSFKSLLDTSQVYFFGDGMAKSKELLGQYPNACFVDGFVQSSVHLYGPAAAALKAGRTDHVALYEPFYFKEFIAGKGSVSPGS
ncbi:MAG: tRNA (adenosine(37)-N6)-threonylcarbamoyltransferase complex dimerization subunit type 1 TsaB [Flavobacteriales bacterium]